MTATSRIHPVSIDTRNRIVWKSSNCSLARMTAIFSTDIRPAAARNQISSIGFEIAKQANQSKVSCTEVLVVAASLNLEGNE